MQFGKSEGIRTLNYHRVGIRDVNARFNDGRADKDVDAPFNELLHDILQLNSAHLSVRHRDAGIRSQTAYAVSALFDGIHTVVNVEDLSAAAEFPGKSGGDKGILLLGDYGMDRQTLHRSRCNRAQIPQSGHRHVKGSGNRRGGHSQHVDCGPDRFQLFLVLHAETLFLVNDDESEIMELHIRADQRMGSDDNVNGAFRETRQQTAPLFSHFQAGERLNDNRIFRKPFRETQIMLLGKNRCRHKDRNLFPRYRALECGTHGDLGFSVSDISAEEAVHRALRLHVKFNLFDGFPLSVGLLEWEGVLEQLLIVSVLRKRQSRRGLADRLHPEHLTGKIPRGGRGLLPCFRPSGRTELRELRPLHMRTDVTGNQVRLPYRNIHHCIIVKFQHKRFDGTSAALHVFKSAVPAKAVIQMHGQIPFLDICHVLQLTGGRPGNVLLLRSLGPYTVLPAQDCRKKFPFGQKHDFLFRKHNAAGNGQIPNGKIRAVRKPILPEPFGNVFGIGFLRRGQNHLHSHIQRTGNKIHGEAARKLRYRLGALLRGGPQRRRDSDAVPIMGNALFGTFNFRGQFIDRRQLLQKSLPVFLRVNASIFLKSLHTGFRRIDDGETSAGVIGKIEIFSAVDRFASGTGNHPAGLNLPKRTPGVRRIFPHGLDLIPEKLQTDRIPHSRGIDIQNPSAPGKLAHGNRFRLIVITERNQRLDQFSHRDHLVAMEQHLRTAELLRIGSRRKKSKNRTDEKIGRGISGGKRKRFRALRLIIQRDSIPPGSLRKQAGRNLHSRRGSPHPEFMIQLLRNPVGRRSKDRFPSPGQRIKKSQCLYGGGIFIHRKNFFRGIRDLPQMLQKNIFQIIFVSLLIFLHLSCIISNYICLKKLPDFLLPA